MSFKAKTVLNKDIRVFKKDINNIGDAFEALENFIKEKYELQAPFSIQYEDEEKDVITIASSEDLEEAYNQAETNGTVLKLLIVPDDIGVPVYSITTELDKSEDNNDNNNNNNNDDVEKKESDSSSSCSSSSDDENENENEKKPKCVGKKLLNDLANNKEFREEFINFVTTFIVKLQDDMLKVTNDAFTQSLNAHENVNQHPAMKKLAESFPTLISQFQPFLSFINTIDVENIGELINSIIGIFNNNNNNNNNGDHFRRPPPLFHMLMQFLGPLGGRHCFGPPPPPPPFNPLAGLFNMFIGGNNNTPFGSYGHHHPPPHPHHGFGHHGPHHKHHHDHHHGHHGHHGFGHRHGHGYHGRHGHGFGRHGCFDNNNNNNNNNGDWQKVDKEEKCPWKRKHFGKCHGKWSRKEENSDYNVEIIKDNLTLSDKGYVLPGQVVVKTWLIKNIGKKDWPQGVSLKYDGKAFNPIISGVAFSVPSLKVGEEAEVAVTIETPKEDSNHYGKQKAFFKLSLPDGTLFGPLFKIRLFIVNENDMNNNNNNNDSEEEKNDQKNNDDNNNYKKHLKKSFKQDKNHEKKKDKLLKEKAKLEEKVAKLDAKLVKQEEKLSKIQSDNNSNDNNNNNNNDINDDIKDIYPNLEENQQQAPVLSSNASVLPQSEPAPVLPFDNNAVDDNNEHEKDASSSFSFSEVDGHDVEVENNQGNNNNNNNDEPVIVSNIKNESPKEKEPFKYEEQLNSLIGMGFDDVDQVRRLLNENNGNIDAVVNLLFN